MLFDIDIDIDISIDSGIDIGIDILVAQFGAQTEIAAAEAAALPWPLKHLKSNQSPLHSYCWIIFDTW